MSTIVKRVAPSAEVRIQQHEPHPHGASMKHRHVLWVLVVAGVAAAAPASWKRIAAEEQAFNVGEVARTVRYGAGAAWIEKTVTGTGECSNSFFGADPA